jgi:hypothetical protein
MVGTFVPLFALIASEIKGILDTMVKSMQPYILLTCLTSINQNWLH